jgi:hypothetical protein
LEYVTAIEWIRLPKDKCTVYHLASPTLKNKELLPVAGAVLRGLLQQPELMDTIERGKPFALSTFGKPPPKLSDVQIVFDRRFGDSAIADSGTGS